MHKVMLSVAPVSAAPHVIVPEEIAEDVYNCYNEGASMVHLHVRDQNAALTPDLTLLKETIDAIHSKCDIVVEISTGGVSNLTIEERCQPCYPDYVEANSLNVGSVNLGASVYQNPIADVRYCVDQILSNHKLPETELFELGMVHTVRQLAEEFPFRDPILLALVFGHGGEMPATRAALNHMLSYIDEEFGTNLCDRAPALQKISGLLDRPMKSHEIIWGYTQADRRDWTMMRYAIEQGADSLRVGFEDSDYLNPDTRVRTNAPLIHKAAEVVRNSNAEPMTTAEVRSIMGIGE